MTYRRFFYIIEIYEKSSFLSPISVFYKPNRLKVAKIQPNKNLIRNGLKKEILTAEIFSCPKDQKRVSVFAYVALTPRKTENRTNDPKNETAEPLQSRFLKLTFTYFRQNQYRQTCYLISNNGERELLVIIYDIVRYQL